MFWLDNAENADDFLETVLYVKRYYHARIIAAVTTSAASTELFEDLIENGVKEIISISQNTDYKAELSTCISYEGKTFADVTALKQNAAGDELRRQFRKIELPPGEVLKIAVVGAFQRCGATSRALGIYRAAEKLGLRACFIDSENKTLPFVIDENAAETGGVFAFSGINFALDEQANNDPSIFNCLIFDGDNLHTHADIAVLCGGTKPWEIIPTIEKAAQFPDSLSAIVFSFSSKAEQNEYSALTGEDLPVCFAPYEADIWHAKNTTLYEKILLDYAKSVKESEKSNN
jgi:hypothetical protein